MVKQQHYINIFYITILSTAALLARQFIVLISCTHAAPSSLPDNHKRVYFIKLSQILTMLGRMSF